MLIIFLTSTGLKKLYKQVYTLIIKRCKMQHNMRKHEHVGLLLVFLGATWLGIGLYDTLLVANKILLENATLIGGREMFIFPLFYGIGAVLFMMGIIELRELQPGKNRL